MWTWCRKAYDTLTFGVIGPILQLGNTRPLQDSDLPSLNELASDLYAQSNYAALQTEWRRQLHDSKAPGGKPPSLFRAFVNIHWRTYMLAAALMCINVVATLLGPVLLSLLVTFAEDRKADPDSVSEWEGYRLGLGLFLCGVANSLARAHGLHLSQKLLLSIRSALVLAIYNKSLALSPQSRGSYSSGAVVNLMSVDTSRMLEFYPGLQMIWTSPVLVGVGLYLMSRQVGSAASAAIGVMILALPISGFIVKAMMKSQKKAAAGTDKRLNITNELLAGIRVVKFYAWEEPFLKRLDESRSEEMADVAKYVFAKSFNFGVLLITPAFVSVVTFVVYIAEGGEMDAATVFTTLSLISVIRFPFTFLPMAINFWVQMMISFGRIGRFLLMPERDDHQIEQLPAGQVGVSVKDGQFGWGVRTHEQEDRGKDKGKQTHGSESDNETPSAQVGQTHKGGSQRALVSREAPASASQAELIGPSDTDTATDAPRPVLTGISFEAGSGELICVVGPVACGKSTLLASLLGETISRGKVCIGGRIAYVPQKAFITNATVRDNILFGCAWDEQRYWLVVQKCCLMSDLAMLPSGDMTEVGERGINISGGQKQRISLARAAYRQDVDVFLLDDPLSAVDAHVGRALFADVINGPLMAGKTRILVTHALSFLHLADQIIVLGPVDDSNVDVGVDVAGFGAPHAAEMKDHANGHAPGTDLQQQEQQQQQQQQQHQRPGVSAVNTGEVFLHVDGLDADDDKDKRAAAVGDGGDVIDSEAAATAIATAAKEVTESHAGAASSGSSLSTVFTITEVGKFEELVRDGKQFTELMKVFATTQHSQEEQEDDTVGRDDEERERKIVDGHLFDDTPMASQMLPQVTHMPSLGGSCSEEEEEEEEEDELGGPRDDAAESKPLSPESRSRAVSDVQTVGAGMMDGLNVPSRSHSRSRSRKSRSRSHSGAHGGGSAAQLPSRSTSKSTSKLKKLSLMPTRRALTSTEEAEQMEKGRLTEEEERELGRVTTDVYIAYVTAAVSRGYLGTVALLYLVTQLGLMGGSVWLSHWTDNVAEAEDTGTELPHSHQWYLGVYAAIMLGAGLILVSRGIATAYFGVETSKALHQKLLHTIARKTTRWFDVTPIGRVLNRCSKDMYELDFTLSQMLEHTLVTMLGALSIILLITVVAPPSACAWLVLSWFYMRAQLFYRRSAREIQRIESLTRTPIFNHFSETLTGVSVIMAMQQQERYRRNNQLYTDVNQRSLYLQQGASFWLRVRLDFIGSTVVLVTAIMAVLSQRFGMTLSPGLVGLILVHSLQVTDMLNWSVILSTRVESKMNSVERVLHYSTLRDEEEEQWEARNATTDQQALQSHWPQRGNIKILDLELRYTQDLPAVVKNLTVEIPAGTRVGIIGRTGSGKSSLLNGLFRVIEATRGSIVIDGVDIAQLSLRTLRSGISIIPQDPVLFAGTLRHNLDPFHRYTDEQIWVALQHVQLSDFVRRLPGGLLSNVSEAGDNLSVGQRQLLCMARALLRDSRVICLDEATASVDVETDEVIQTVVREQLSGPDHKRTILTIAHRLNTILDYDNVMVMEAGLLKEFGAPGELSRNTDSLFYSMLEASREATKKKEQEED